MKFMAEGFNKSFFEVFSKYKTDNETREILEKSSILSIKINKEMRRIIILLKFQDYVPFSTLQNISLGIESAYELELVRIKPYFSSECFCLENIEDIIKLLKDEMPAVNGFLDNSSATLSDNVLCLKVKYGGAGILSSLGCDKTLIALAKDQFGCDIRVEFENEEYEFSLSEYENKINGITDEVQSSVNINYNDDDAADNESENCAQRTISIEKSKEIVQTESANSGEILYGKKIKGNIIPIRDCKVDSGTVIVAGDVFALRIKETKDTLKYIITFNITDNDSSIIVKLFGEKTKLGDITKNLKNGKTVIVRGRVADDLYEKDIIIKANSIIETKKVIKTDNADEKRVELHLHTTMSAMDAVSTATELIDRAAKWGHKAIAITDHGNAQAYPEAMKASEKLGIKVIYGLEGYFVNDTEPAVFGDLNSSFDDEFIVFDIETTGLSPVNDRITEIGAVRVKNGKIIENFNTFVNPERQIPENIINLTGITDEMVKDAPLEKDAISLFFDFAHGKPLVAHNASFDTGFLRQASYRCGLDFDFTYIDTVPICRALLKELKSVKLNLVAQYLKLPEFNHHRASDDATVLAHILFNLFKRLREEKEISDISQINGCLTGIDPKRIRPNHIVILVKNYIGLKNLYKLISRSHLEFYHRNPRIPKSILMQYREGLIIGSACESGELYRAVLDNKPWNELVKIASFYDYLEIQPLGNNQFLIEERLVPDKNKLIELNKTIIRLGQKTGKPVIATGDVHFRDPNDEVFRRIIMAGQGFSDADKQAPLYLRTTDEMLAEFDYLEPDEAYEIVVKNPNLIADMCEKIRPVPKGAFPPELPGSEEELKYLTENRAREIYGDTLPQIVKDRTDKELNSIIKHGFSVMYMIAQKLVAKSLSDGYLVGSRGSVGSSFVAFLSGITEVNALCPHYVCPNCKNSDFITDGSYGSGVDMPDKNCPKCGTKYKKDGFDIPFETFLGFDGDKAPDIDLNFSGDYQPRAHKYTEELFGEGYVFRAGTIGTIADKTAYGFVKKYADERNLRLHKAEMDRLIKGCTGIKRTTGQHPGGVIIVPKSKEIYDFCPIQHPADDVNTDIITTHFEYHSIDENLLKLDILGHDDPTVIKMLEDLTGVDARQIPLDDPETMSIFTSVKALNIEKDDIIGEVGSLGIPEFGTRFVRQMLIDTSPRTFSELVRISGLSHGTDVWINNAQILIRDKIVELKDAICTRDDIMLYLIQKGMDPKLSFIVMESVRKGRGLKPEWEDEMRKHDVPDWYIKSCKKIQYMFPKAHAVAYVTMAYRIAYFKVHEPLAFYAAYFTVRADVFDATYMIHGSKLIRDTIKEIEANKEATQKDKDMVTILEVCYEMNKRGFNFCPIDLYKSHASKFLITDDGLLPPLSSLQGVGESAANAIVKAREEEEFLCCEEIRNRAKVSKAVIEALKNEGVLNGIPDSMQLSLF